ncbi:hypothetical protein GCM10027406_07600 [Leifsonia lichenia]
MLPLPSPAELDDLADRGWPALEREQLGPWTLRFADGVTNRANSVLPSGQVDAVALPALVGSAEQAYRRRGLPAVFQVSPATDAALPAELGARGYREHSATHILVADRARIAEASAAVTVASTPSRPWMQLWWSVDGRGDSAAQAVAERILIGVPALYVGSGAPERPDAVARLAIVNGWGGLFAVATRPEARRRGHAAALIRAVADASADHGVERLWLQVMADNAAAVALYEGLGFVQASSYSYWTESAG